MILTSIFCVTLYLADVEVFDLSNNTLIGQIPSELDNLQVASIHLSLNSDL